jgi:tight adherence protein B
VSLPLAILLSAIAGALVAPALLTAAGSASPVLATLGPLIKRFSEMVDRVLTPLRLAGAEGIVPTDKERVRLCAGAAAVGLVLGFALSGPVSGFGAAAVAAWVAARAFAWRRERYRRRLDAGAAAAALALADALEAGQSVRGALAEAGRGLAAPIGGELQRVGDELEVGAETEETLERLRLRARSRRINLIVAAVRIQRRAGGGLAKLLRDIAATIEEHDRLEDDARAASAQARFTSVVVLCLPLFGLVTAELAAPGFVTRLAGSAVGTWLLAVALLLQLAGLLLIRRLSRVDT